MFCSSCSPLCNANPTAGVLLSTELTMFLFLWNRLTEELSSGVPTTWWGRPRYSTWAWTPPASTPLSAVRTAASGGRMGTVGILSLVMGREVIFECFSSGCRIFNINSGKQKKLYKGSLSEDGSLLRVTLASARLLLPVCALCVDPRALFALAGPAWSVGSVRSHQLLWQKHQHLWIQHWGVCRHHAGPLW